MNRESNHPKLSIAGDGPPPSVPAFPCIVYVAKLPDGGVRARVANLAGIEIEADSEPAALSKIVAEFKRRVGDFVTGGEEIPWIEPPPEIGPDEQKRFVPVHL